MFDYYTRLISIVSKPIKVVVLVVIIVGVFVKKKIRSNKFLIKKQIMTKKVLDQKKLGSKKS